jgi:signal transduction histidine kinase
MQSLLTSLLEYSRVTAKAEPPRRVNLTEIVREVLSDLEVSIVQSGGEIQVEELPAVEADPTQMRQLFQNLLGNALKFHKEGEKPVIRVRSNSTGKRKISVVIEDNGIGFDEKYIDRIFSPFERLHGRHEFQGTGMGLANCKKIVERHGGDITAASTPGKGSIFIISLPPEQPTGLPN